MGLGAKQSEGLRTVGEEELKEGYIPDVLAHCKGTIGCLEDGIVWIYFQPLCNLGY